MELLLAEQVKIYHEAVAHKVVNRWIMGGGFTTERMKDELRRACFRLIEPTTQITPSFGDVEIRLYSEEFILRPDLHAGHARDHEYYLILMEEGNEVFMHFVANSW